MTEPEDKILALVASGKISAEEGEELLNALKSKKKNQKFLFNPYEALSSSQLWLIAVGLCLFSIALGQANIHFPSLIEVRISPGKPLPPLMALVEQVAAWLIPATTAWGVCWIYNRSIRWVDVFQFIGVARFPLVCLGLYLALFMNQIPEENVSLPNDNLSLIPLLLVSVLSLGGFISMLVTAIRIVSGVKGGGVAVLTIATIIISWLLSFLWILLWLPYLR